MKVKSVKRPANSASQKTRKFCGDASQGTVDTVLDVNVVDAEGNPIEEKSLSQDQIEFCAKVAAKKFKAFASSKRKAFNADEESIDVVLPENIDDADIDQIVADAVDEREIAADPDEVVVEVEDDEMPEVEVEDAEEKQFSGKGKKGGKRQFSSEDRKESDKVEEEIETAVDDIQEHEELDDQDENPKDFEGVSDVKKFAAGSVEDRTSSALDAILSEGSVDSFKQKFFSAGKR